MKKYQYLIMVFAFISAGNVFCSNTVQVGAYNFPPFIEWKGKTPKGLTVELINKLNSKQKKYHFELVETSSLRRYEDFEAKRYDLMFFESLDWGWKGHSIEASKVFKKGGEVFIALKKNNDQNYFSSLKDKKIRGISGYHYGFLNFSTSNADYKKYNVETTSSHIGNIEAVLDGRVDLAIVTKEFLDIYFAKNTQNMEKLLVSKKFDQEYLHTVLIRKNSKISIKEINQMLELVK